MQRDSKFSLTNCSSSTKIPISSLKKSLCLIAPHHHHHLLPTCTPNFFLSLRESSLLALSKHELSH